MNLKFEFLDSHMSHLTQLGIITIILKCQKEFYYSMQFSRTLDNLFGSY
jgi:hypothetical protein